MDYRANFVVDDGWHLEPFPGEATLQFPPLTSCTLMNKKRAHHREDLFPSKRRRESLPIVDDSTWIDALMDAWSPKQNVSFEETASLVSYHPEDQQETSATSIYGGKECDSSLQGTTITEPWGATHGHSTTQEYSENSSGSNLDDSSSQSGILHSDPSGYHSRIISQSQLSDGGHEPSVESVLFDPTGLEVPPRPAMSSIASAVAALPNHDSFEDSSRASTMLKIKNSNAPTLLTLTSYPYRIMYSNRAFSDLSGRNTSVIGESVFDIFSIEGSLVRPCLATYPTLPSQFESKIALVTSFSDGKEEGKNNNSIRCEVQANPITKRDDPNSLLYYSIRFTRVRETA